MEFTLTTTIKATPEMVYEAWLSSEKHSAMTGGEAIISNKINDTFSAWDDYISGVNIELESGKRIVQSWRTVQFEENEPDSQIEVLLSEKNGETELTLIHTNVPESGEHYKKGWDDSYFQPMKNYFNKK